jgi:hypothetical protein
VFEVLAIAGMICTFGFEPLKSESQHLVQDGQVPPVDHFIIETADDRFVVLDGHTVCSFLFLTLRATIV